ncbi:MAG TPA: hypothetical protein VNG12_18600 [Acidimicrobiales bacterium]|nr:hypothetical protein [Acidimicrobiales bacterium]
MAQRVVVVVALGLALLAAGIYISFLGLPGGAAGGFENAIVPSPSQGFSPPMLLTQAGPDLSPWQQLLVWLGLILVWAALSVVVLRPPRRLDAEAETVA